MHYILGFFSRLTRRRLGVQNTYYLHLSIKFVVLALEWLNMGYGVGQTIQKIGKRQDELSVLH